MANLDADLLLAMLRDPGAESRDVAAAAGVPREEAGRAARLVAAIARANADEALTLPGPLAVAVARAALAASRADLLAALAAHREKEVAKEAKRGLHLLRSRGVAVPEPPRPAAPAAAPEPPLPAYVSAVDGHGERAVWLPRSVPGKGIEIAQAVISDVHGLVELQVGHLGRKEWRGVAKDLLSHGPTMGVGEVDRERAKSLIAAARALNDTSGQRVPEGADLWLAQLGPAAPPPDPAAGFPPLPPDQERDALAASAALHELPLLRGWLADEEFLRGIAAKLDEAAVSPLYVDERQRAERMAGIVAEAVEASLDPERRRRVTSRLFAVAEHLRDTGEASRADAAAAAARALATGAPASSVPFARLLVEKAFPAVSPGAGGLVDAPPDAPTPPESPLIVAPR